VPSLTTNIVISARARGSTSAKMRSKASRKVPGTSSGGTKTVEPAWLTWSFHSPGLLSGRCCMTCAFTLLSQVRNPSASCAGRSRQGGRVAAAKVPRMSWRVRAAVLDDLAVEDDAFGLGDRERRAFDVDRRPDSPRSRAPGGVSPVHKPTVC